MLRSISSRKPIGKQDQYIAAYDGITCFEFCKDDTVKASPLAISEETLFNLEDNLLLFFTGYSRAASAFLKEQEDKSKRGDADMIGNLHFIKELAFMNKQALEAGDVAQFGRLMNVHWEYKKLRSAGMTNRAIDAWYDCAMNNGALDGKLIGAGGGGFPHVLCGRQNPAASCHAGKGTQGS
jgi:D-glycero-alpha-D-manno-heptose-7-phosphate kinase